LDFSDTTYIDSSALGMLLILREKVNPNHAAEKTTNIKLVNTNSEIFKILGLANFNMLFDIE